jgi:phage FluMu protein Com
VSPDFLFLNDGWDCIPPFLFIGVPRMDNKIEFRCKNCRKLLCNTDGNTDIVCPRCGGLNDLDIDTRKIRYIPKSERRESSSGVRFSNS